MTRYEELALQLKVCELSLTQIGLELEYGSPSPERVDHSLDKTKEAVVSLIDSVAGACNAQDK